MATLKLILPAIFVGLGLYPSLTQLVASDTESSTSGFFSDATSRPCPSAPPAESDTSENSERGESSSSDLPESSSSSETDHDSDDGATEALDMAEEGRAGFGHLHLDRHQRQVRVAQQQLQVPLPVATMAIAQQPHVALPSHPAPATPIFVGPVALAHLRSVGLAPDAAVATPQAAPQAAVTVAQAVPLLAGQDQAVARGGARGRSASGSRRPVRSRSRRKRPRSRYVMSEESLSSVDDEEGFPSRISPRNKKPFQGYTKF